MMKEMKLDRLILDPVTNTPIILLKDKEDTVTIPIWIGVLEASAIAVELEKIYTPRPMTHDLMKNMLATLKAHLTRVEITDLRDSTFYALIHLTMGKKSITIDARPSDAIALAVRASSPIYVDELVIKKLEKANWENVKPVNEQGESAKWKELLEGMSADDFGKYKM